MPKSHEILMFVCLQKDAKQRCDAAKLDHTHEFYETCHSVTFYFMRVKPIKYTLIFHKGPLALQQHSIVWHLFGDKQTSKSHQT